MKILFATSEAAPFVKTGGLGDVAGSLPIELKGKGVDVRVILPLYHCIPEKFKANMKYINHIYISMAWRKQYCGIFELVHEGCTYYFIDNEFYFGGDKPYGYIHEDCEKFIFFSKAALSILPTIDFKPDVINCNDWQSATIPVFLDTFRDNPFYNQIKTVMTIHNLKFQGRWNFEGIKDAMGISDYYFTQDKLEFYKDANLLKGGLVYANKISTVSSTYAKEITTAEYGEGLNGLLSSRQNDLVGIVNGISYVEWNCETDDLIFENYTKENVDANKKINKIKLQQQLNIPIDENKFTIGIVSRLTDQKGFDLLASSLEALCNDDLQIIILGTGDEKYENLFRHYAWKYPQKISSNIYFSNELSHKIYAGCDAFLMPSRFEPCGLSQLISLRYGTLPIVRETGGLKDTVIPFNEYTGEGNGFSFYNYCANDMLYVIHYAMDIFYNKRDSWNGIIKNAMEADFSWSVSSDKYIQMYRELIEDYVLDEKKSKKINKDESVLASENITSTDKIVKPKKNRTTGINSTKDVKPNEVEKTAKKTTTRTKSTKPKKEAITDVLDKKTLLENKEKPAKKPTKTTTSSKTPKSKTSS